MHSPTTTDGCINCIVDIAVQHIVFSDVDGTLVHYPTSSTTVPPNDEDDESSLILAHLPPEQNWLSGCVIVAHARTLSSTAKRRM